MKNDLTPLQALEEIISTFYDKDSEEIRIVKTALKKWKEHQNTCQELYYKERCEKQDKILQIIKERNIDVSLIKNTKNYDEYCHEFAIKVLMLKDEKFFVKNKGITEKEYNMLKGVLLWKKNKNTLKEV